MTRAHNFCAGPAALPTEVLEIAQSEILDWHGRGVSIMEMSHRSADFTQVANEAEQDLRDLMNISDDYAVLFMQGGATAQFSLIPMNLANGKPVDYITTGQWSQKAIKEARRYADVNEIGSSEGWNHSRVPSQTELKYTDGAGYIHYCPNETIGGLEFDYVPENGDVPVIADMSSTILSRPMDVNKFGVIYAGAQKNIGPAGINLVIIRKDLLERASDITPAVFTYKNVATNDSMLNTPPTYSWYLSGLVFKWLKKQGGVEAIGKINEEKANLLYNYIDQSDFFANPIEKHNRSIMNVPFTLADSNLDKVFLQESEKEGLLNLKGHRSVGGMRASIYNAVGLESVKALVEFMKLFEQRHG